jgi:hypothetical protein
VIHIGIESGKPIYNMNDDKRIGEVSGMNEPKHLLYFTTRRFTFSGLRLVAKSAFSDLRLVAKNL